MTYEKKLNFLTLKQVAIPSPEQDVEGAPVSEARCITKYRTRPVKQMFSKI